MRVLALLLILSLLPAAHAQEAGCTQAEPCEWIVDIDTGGISGELNVTQGDWYQFEFFNFDGESHTVGIAALGLSWTIAAADGATSDAILFDAPGEYLMRDEPTGTSATVRVLVNDAVDVEQGESPIVDDDLEKDTPGLAVPLLLALLAGIAMRRR